MLSSLTRIVSREKSPWKFGIARIHVHEEYFIDHKDKRRRGTTTITTTTTQSLIRNNQSATTSVAIDQHKYLSYRRRDQSTFYLTIDLIYSRFNDVTIKEEGCIDSLTFFFFMFTRWLRWSIKGKAN